MLFLSEKYIVRRVKSSDRRVSAEIIDSENHVSVFRMTKAMWEKYNLEAGDILEIETYKDIENTSALSEAVTKAAGYLASSAYSEKGLYQKLKRSGFSASVSERAASLMKKKGLIDETTQAINFAKSSYKRALRGPARIENDLIARGYSREDAKVAAESITKEQYDKALDIHIEKKCPGGIIESEQKKRSAISSLIRLGFGYSDIMKKMNGLVYEYNDKTTDI